MSREILKQAPNGGSGQCGGIQMVSLITAAARLLARNGCPKGDMGYAAALTELKRMGAPAAPAK